MSKLPSKHDADNLKTLIDKISLYEVLGIIEAICAEKADHIRANYGDTELARRWFNAGLAVSIASENSNTTEAYPYAL